jgi:nitrilase
MLKVAVAQAGSVMFDTPRTMERVESLCRKAAAQNAELLVLPEAMLGGYPKGLSFGATVGNRTEEGRELFRRYMEAAIRCPGPETTQFEALARELNLHLVTGAVERDGNTLYCISLVITPCGGVVAKHRKLMPTGSERLIWGFGGGDTMQVVHTEIGRIGTAICWENYMPLYRQHLYNQGVELWCAPTVDAREMWQTSMRHIAYEGRCFVLSACQQLETSDWPAELQRIGGEIDGRSLIVSPRGELLAGPVAEPDLLLAHLDMDEIQRGKFDLDVAGHYSRPDIFRFEPRLD